MAQREIQPGRRWRWGGVGLSGALEAAGAMREDKHTAERVFNVFHDARVKNV